MVYRYAQRLEGLGSRVDFSPPLYGLFYQLCQFSCRLDRASFGNTARYPVGAGFFTRMSV